MEFVKKMKKRELIEMSIKAIIAVLASLITIVLMEGMIYGIELNTYLKNSKSAIKQSNLTVAYCIERAEDEYFVMFYNPTDESKSGMEVWSAQSFETKKYSHQDCLNLQGEVKEVKFGAPNAFTFSITPVHFVVMGVFVGLVAGYFVYRFVALNVNYKKYIKTVQEKGTIEIENL